MNLGDLLSEPWVASIHVSAGAALCAGGLAYLTYITLLDPMRVPWLRERRDALDLALDRLMLPRRGEAIVNAQCGLALGCVLLALLARQPAWLAPAAGAFVLVPPLLDRAVERRRRTIDTQLDAWLTGLANALRAAPALGEAITATLPLAHGGLREELRLVLRKAKLGTPVETGLSELASRVGSPTVSAAVMTLRIAARSGGNLGATLDTTASALREMARLEGILQTQTAGGRTQAMMVSAVPLPLIALLHYIDPSYLAPMWTTALGRILLAAAALLWLVAGLWARKIVRVDL